ncbi:MAG: aldehyde dehydrogenase family protein [Actinomycetota bacterium]
MAELALEADAIQLAVQRHGPALAAAVIDERAFTVRSMQADGDGFLRELEHMPALRASLSGSRPVAGEPGSEILCVLPFNLGLWALIPVVNLLMGGNRVRLKLPRGCPRSVRAMQDVVRDFAGPDVVTFDQRPGPALLDHAMHDERCRGVCLYGSDRAGLAFDPVTDVAGRRVLFEGPGNNPAIVLADASADVGDQLVAEKFDFFAGQACLAPERVLVHRSRYDEVIDRVREGMQSLVVGEAADPATDIGPIRFRALRERLGAQVQDAAELGGEVVTGGAPDGEWMLPTLVAGLTPEMRVTREEVFGPVLYVGAFDDPDEAVAHAQLSPYGLGATVWGQGATAARVIDRLQGAQYLEPVAEREPGTFGCVDLNGIRRANSLDLPFGGYGLSGWVRAPADDGQGTALRQGPKHVAREFVVPATHGRGSDPA